MQDAFIHKTCPVSHRLWVKHNWLLFHFCYCFHQLLWTSPVHPDSLKKKSSKVLNTPTFFKSLSISPFSTLPSISPFSTLPSMSLASTLSSMSPSFTLASISSSCRQAPCFCAAGSSALSTPPARSTSLSGPVRTKLTTAPHPPSSVSILVAKSAVGARPRSVSRDGRDRV